MLNVKTFVVIGVIVAAIIGVGIVTGQDDSVCVTGGAVPTGSAGLISDCETLLSVKSALRGSANLNWWSDRSIEEWDGITVENGRVTEVSLPNRSLDGIIPAGFGSLSALKTLDLSGNTLRGTIPASLNSLTALTKWRLAGNGLSGCVPYDFAQVSDNDAASLNLLACGGPGPGGGSTAIEARLNDVERRLAELEADVERRLAELEAAVAQLTAPHTDDHANSFEGATPATVGEPMQGTVDYDGDNDVFAFEVEEGVVYQVDVELGTLLDSWLAIYDSEEFEIAFNDDRDDDSLASRIVGEVPSSGEYFVEVGGYGVGSYTLTVAVSDIVDDHATNSVEGATPMTVGEPMQGTVDYDGDNDVFAFEVEEGVLYQIDVELGTLPDSWLELYDSDEFQLASNDDRGDASPASRVVWEAPSSGEYYVAVGGYGVGSYTLTVEALDIVDDHANIESVEEATVVTVGEAMQGTVDYDGDNDVFAFEVEEGVLYQIDVGLGTLLDSWLVIFDSDEIVLASNDDRDDDSPASRIVWEAPSSGEYYAVVGGYGVGSYTLTVEALDIVDDHANSFEGATPATVGEAMQGTVDYDGDEDFFVFEAEKGKIYQIDVDLGTLPDSELRLYDSDEFWMAYNDDRGDGSPASRIVWKAPSSGEYYAAVRGYYGIGSYTLTVAVSDIANDHADSVEGATPATVGKPIQDGVTNLSEALARYSGTTLPKRQVIK